MGPKLHKDAFPKQGWAVVKELGDIATDLKAVLAGGTALSLQIGHRVSYDLDFFVAQDFEVEPIVLALSKKGLKHQVISEGSGTLHMDVEGIKVSFFTYGYPFLAPTIEAGGMRLAGVMDIASMKVIALNQRGTKRDFVDLYTILQSYPFHLIATHMVRRFGRERISPLDIGKSLVYFADAETNPEPAYLKGKAIKWNKIKDFYRAHVRQFVYDLDSALRKL